MSDCPQCGGPTHVIDSRKARKVIRRRRVCDSHGHRHTTYEIPRVDDKTAEILDWVIETIWDEGEGNDDSDRTRDYDESDQVQTESVRP